MSVYLEEKRNDSRSDAKNAIVRARVNAATKKDVEDILDDLGISISEAINIYLAQIKLTRSIPFAIKMPNKTTLKTFADTDKGKNVKKVKNVREIFAKAGF